MKNFQKILVLILVFAASGSFVYAQDAQNNQDETLAKFDAYFEANEKDAKNMLGSYTDQELKYFVNKYKSGKPSYELRSLKIIRQIEMRTADRKAGERLFYVFLAISLLVLLILVFLIKIYRMQKQLLDEEKE
ncbi:MAG: hypothetical protein ABUK01_12490 [Leptospirales bacterium]